MVNLILQTKKSKDQAKFDRYSMEPFAGANGQIPQLNLWDDHDVSVLFCTWKHQLTFVVDN
jgi:hypothetical protein